MSPWIIVFLEQKSPLEDSHLGLKSPWIKVFLEKSPSDNSPLDNCSNASVPMVGLARFGPLQIKEAGKVSFPMYFDDASSQTMFYSDFDAI